MASVVVWWEGERSGEQTKPVERVVTRVSSDAHAISRAAFTREAISFWATLDQGKRLQDRSRARCVREIGEVSAINAHTRDDLDSGIVRWQ